MNHDNYDNQILKALQSIAKSLKNIEAELAKANNMYLSSELDSTEEEVEK